jgi:tRNA modification GTPase
MFAKALLPTETAVSLNRRQGELVAIAHAALGQASHCDDLVLIAEHMRTARSAFDRVTGRAGVEDVLDALFSRFCLGK